MTQNLICQNYVQTLNPACIRLTVKIQFETLEPFCELQIFSDPVQVYTHPKWAFLPDYTQHNLYTETFGLWFSQQVNTQ